MVYEINCTKKFSLHWLIQSYMSRFGELIVLQIDKTFLKDFVENVAFLIFFYTAFYLIDMKRNLN